MTPDVSDMNHLLIISVYVSDCDLVMTCDLLSV